MTRPSGTVVDQVMTPDSPLSGFLERTLPGRSEIADNWYRSLARAPVAGIRVDREHAVVGKAYEMRVGLDLADQPGYRHLLAFLPASQCEALLCAAGFESGTEDDEPVIDPMLRGWARASMPLVNGTAQVKALSSCFDAASWGDMAHRVGHSWPVQWSRSAPRLFHRTGADYRRTPTSVSALTGLTHLWKSYVVHGRRQLLGLGSRVVIEPLLAPGFAEADMIVGRTMVEVKTVLKPSSYAMRRWLDQVLAYVLLDKWDVYCLTDLAVFTGWEATLCKAPIDTVLQIGSPGASPTLTALRAELADVLHDDLGDAYRAHMHRRYPPPDDAWVTVGDLPDSSPPP